MLASVISGRPVAETSSSKQAFRTASEWIGKCKQNHPICATAHKELPTRVIDIGTAARKPRLLVTDGNEGRWATLSHCWGPTRDGITTTENLAKRRQEIDVDALPVLFRDAIDIARELGYLYLWIDSICIIQNSDKDWAAECQKMDAYYSGSDLTISASAAASTAEGIFHSADKFRYNPQLPIKVQCFIKSPKIDNYMYLRSPHECNHNDPLNRRGWVTQEVILSHRIFQYGSGELSWKCCHGFLYERVPSSLFFRSKYGELEMPVYRSFRPPWELYTGTWPTTILCWWYSCLCQISPFLTKKTPTLFSGFKFHGKWQARALCWWYGMLTFYLRKDLTRYSDRLPAIAGLAKDFSNYTGFHYKCGIWEEDILGGLSWIAYGQKQSGDFSTSSPSWSWVSMQKGFFGDGRGIVDFYRWNLDGWSGTGFLYMPAEVLDVSIKNKFGDIYGQVESASITLKGPCQLMKQCLSPPFFINKALTSILGDCKFMNKFDLLPSRFNNIYCIMDYASATQNNYSALDLNPNVIYFRLGKCERWEMRHLRLFEKFYTPKRPLPKRVNDAWLALILEPVENCADTFRRIGIAEISTEIQGLESWPVKTVVIV